MANTTAAAPGSDAQAVSEAAAEMVELRQIGTFGANEFEESLLSTLGRNRPEGGEDDADCVAAALICMRPLYILSYKGV